MDIYQFLNNELYIPVARGWEWGTLQIFAGQGSKQEDKVHAISM